MRFVFVMDPVGTILIDEDTTFALMLEAQAQGHQVLHCLIQDVCLDGARVLGRVRAATVQREAASPVALGAFEKLDLATVDAVFVRKDPPFDDAYHWLTLILERLRGQTVVVNDPRGLREANEKLYIAHVLEVAPETLVASNRDDILAFTERMGGRAVIKPVDGHGGEGVFLLNKSDPNARAIIETVTANSTRVAMVQRYIPEVEKGDKRIMLVDGEPLGAILRVPQAGDVRSNIHVGGAVVAATLDADDKRIVDALRPHLLRDGLFFVGIDVIGGLLTEVNVTSPTGIQQMSRLDAVNYEKRVIDALAAKVN